MSRKPRRKPNALTVSVDRFALELRQLAIEFARSVIEAEFARVVTGPEKVRSRRRNVARGAMKKGDADSASKPSSTPMKNGREPQEWTRDAVIAELGRWLISSKDLEPAFLKRNGPRGLVEAAKRIFGRFDAALNAANLAIAARMPSSARAPAARQAWPSMRELARRQRDRRAATDAAAGVDPPGS